MMGLEQVQQGKESHHYLEQENSDYNNGEDGNRFFKALLGLIPEDAYK